MAEPVGDIFGMKFATLIAGFAGGVVSLSFVKELKPVQALAAVAVGTVSAGYLSPAVLAYFELPAAIENAAAFLVGLTAMNIIPGILSISNRFKGNPLGVWRGTDSDDQKG